MKKLDYQKTFDGILTNVDKEDFLVTKDSELLFTVAGTIPVYKNDALMMSSGGVIAYITLKSENMRPFIMVDSLFEKLSLNAKVFAIYHELGHYQNGDFINEKKKNKRFNKIKSRFNINKKYPEKEVLADYYAMDKMNSIEDGLNALEEINELVVTMIKNPKQLKYIEKRHKLRMKAIKEMVINGPYFIDAEPNKYTEIYKEENDDIEVVLDEEELSEDLKIGLIDNNDLK